MPVPERPYTRALTPKQESFCQHYARWGNGAAAARAAGYSERCARQQAWELLETNWIQDRVAHLQAAAARTARRELAVLLGPLGEARALALAAGDWRAVADMTRLAGQLTGLLGSRGRRATAINTPEHLYGPDVPCLTAAKDDGRRAEWDALGAPGPVAAAWAGLGGFGDAAAPEAGAAGAGAMAEAGAAGVAPANLQGNISATSAPAAGMAGAAPGAGAPCAQVAGVPAADAHVSGAQAAGAQAAGAQADARNPGAPEVWDWAPPWQFDRRREAHERSGKPEALRGADGDPREQRRRHQLHDHWQRATAAFYDELFPDDESGGVPGGVAGGQAGRAPDVVTGERTGGFTAQFPDTLPDIPLHNLTYRPPPPGPPLPARDSPAASPRQERAAACEADP